MKLLGLEVIFSLVLVGYKASLRIQCICYKLQSSYQESATAILDLIKNYYHNYRALHSTTELVVLPTIVKKPMPVDIV